MAQSRRQSAERPAPRDHYAEITDQVVAALARPDMKERMAANGTDIIGNSPAEFAAFIKTDIAKWAKVVKNSGARVD